MFDPQQIQPPAIPEVDDNITGLPRYRLLRPYIQTGDVLEWKSRSLTGATIRRVTGQDVNHTGGVIRFTEYGDRIFTPEAIGRGFTLTYLSRELENYKGVVYLLPLKHTLERYRRPIAIEQLKLVGTPYDYHSLFKNAISYVSMEVNRLFCSEAIGYSLDTAGVIKLPLLPNGKKMALRPGDFEQFGITLPRVRIY